jgi:hypothetical protein
VRDGGAAEKAEKKTRGWKRSERGPTHTTRWIKKTRARETREASNRSTRLGSGDMIFSAATFFSSSAAE